MKLRVGLVGLGENWESRHRPALISLRDRFDVRAVCSEVAARAEQVAREFEAVAVDGFRALSCRTDVDAVLVLSPDWYGPLPVLAACDSGKAVYCAPALDIALDQAREVRRRVESAGIAFMAEFPRRYAPATIRLKELIATQLGQPQLLFCHARRIRSVSPRKSSVRQFSGSTKDLMEMVDWCRYTVDMEPTSVIGIQHHRFSSGRPAATGPDGETVAKSPRRRNDYMMMSLDFSPPGGVGGGPLAHVSCGSYLPEAWSEALSFRPPAELQVCCENGVAFVDLPSTLIWFDQAGRHHESLESDRPVGEQLLTHFHRSVTSLVRKTADLEDAYKTLNIVLASRESFVTGTRVDLQDGREWA